MSTKLHPLQAVRTKSGFWIILIAAVILETSACIQYFSSRSAIRKEAVHRAQTELRAAELEINVVTAEMEAACKMLTTMAEENLNDPRAMYDCTHTLLATLDHVESAGVAFIPDYYPQCGHWYEICSSRVADTIYTRSIGGAHHDYFQMEWYNNGLTIDSVWWCEPYLDDEGAEAMVVSCSYPIRDKSGAIVGVTCLDVSLSYLSRVSKYLQVYPDSYYSIRSSTGKDIVAKPDTVAGRKYMIFDQEIQATGWHISIIIPEDILFAGLHRISLLITLLMLIGLALLGFILYISARDVQRLLTLKSQQDRMEGELEIAQTIQKAMLPKVFPPFEDRLDLNIYGMVRPAKEIGGDLYDFYVRHDKLFFCVGDVSGKGIPAALIMATTRSLFRSITSHEEHADKIVMQMNEALTEQNDQNMFVTLFLGVLDLKSGELHYCNAGHNAPIFIGEKELCRTLPNLPIGIEAGFPYQSQTMHMTYGQTLFLYTDGLTEAENMQDDQFQTERMIAALQGMRALRPREVVDAMTKAVDEFVGNAPQSDDLTMLAIRYQIPAILMRNDIQQIPTLAEWVEGLDVPANLNMPVNLALEEIVSNVMLYAYPKDHNGKVFVEFVRHTEQNKEQLIFSVSDTGVAFDPTAKPDVDVSLSAEQREIGGLGIHLVRQLMDEVRYAREDKQNVLTLIKNL